MLILEASPIAGWKYCNEYVNSRPLMSRNKDEDKLALIIQQHSCSQRTLSNTRQKVTICRRGYKFSQFFYTKNVVLFWASLATAVPSCTTWPYDTISEFGVLFVLLEFSTWRFGPVLLSARVADLLFRTQCNIVGWPCFGKTTWCWREYKLSDSELNKTALFSFSRRGLILFFRLFKYCSQIGVIECHAAQ